MSESKKIESHFKSNIIGDSYKKTDYDPAEPGNDEMDDAGAEKETDDYEDLPDSDDEEMEEKEEKPKKKSKKKSKSK